MRPAGVASPKSGRGVRTGAGLADVAVDRSSGTLYAGWEDASLTSSQSEAIAFSSSVDGGLSWSAPIAVNRTPTQTDRLRQQAFTPPIQVAPDGRVGGATDFRNSGPGQPGALADYFFVSCGPQAPRIAATRPGAGPRSG
jgi:hypothetical protein